MKEFLYKYDRGYKLLVFFIVFIPKLLLCFFAEPVSFISDEVATMAGGAYWAGLDWSGVVSHAGYYGTGFTAFTAPIFMLTDNPRFIYFLVTVMCTLIQSITAVIAYCILKRFFKIESRKYAAVVSVACGYFVMTASIVVFNEHMIIFLSWIMAFLLLKLHESIDNKKKKRFYTVILFIVMSYALTIHTRMLLFWAALAVTVLFYLWTYKKCLISLPCAAISGIVGYFVSNEYIHFIQKQIWQVNYGTDSLRNAYIGGNIFDSLQLLLSPKSWQAWFNIVFGQLHTISVFSGGLFLIFIVVFIHFMWNKLLRKNWNQEQTGMEARMMPVVVFFSACIAATIAAQSLTWLQGSVDVIHAGFENNLYESKAYGYLRYFGPYCGPILLMGAVFLYHWKDKVLEYRKIVFPIWGFLEFYWLVCIFPYIYHTDQVGALEFYFPFSLQMLTDPIDIKTLFPASIVLAVSLFLLFFLFKKRRLKTVFIWVGILFAYTYFYIGITWDIEFARDNKQLAQNSYELISDMEDAVDLPYEIYVYDSWKKDDHNNYYMYQFLLNRYKIMPELPPENLESTVLFVNDAYTDETHQMWNSQGYKCYKVGEFELLLVKGEDLQQQFMDAGVNLQ